MNIFSKVLLMALLSTMAVGVNAQNLILQGGLNLSNMLEKDDSDTYSDDFKMRPGFHLGATVAFPITDVISFEPGLLFMTRGFKINEEESGLSLKATANLNYLDIPLIFKARYSFDDKMKMYGAIGPYIGIGLSGKVKTKFTSGSTTVEDEEDVSWGNNENEDDIKRGDFGLSFGAGVEISSFLIGISYDLGLANISAYTDEGTKARNRVLKFSVGYIIGL